MKPRGGPGYPHIQDADNNLGLITEGNNYRCCDASSLPLWGNIDIVQANIKRNSGALAGEDQVNVVSQQLANFWLRWQADIINIYQVS